MSGELRKGRFRRGERKRPRGIPSRPRPARPGTGSDRDAAGPAPATSARPANPLPLSAVIDDPGRTPDPGRRSSRRRRAPTTAPPEGLLDGGTGCRDQARTVARPRRNRGFYGRHDPRLSHPATRHRAGTRSLGRQSVETLPALPLCKWTRQIPALCVLLRRRDWTRPTAMRPHPRQPGRSHAKWKRGGFGVAGLDSAALARFPASRAVTPPPRMPNHPGWPGPSQRVALRQRRDVFSMEKRGGVSGGCRCRWRVAGGGPPRSCPRGWAAGGAWLR